MGKGGRRRAKSDREDFPLTPFLCFALCPLPRETHREHATTGQRSRRLLLLLEIGGGVRRYWVATCFQLLPYLIFVQTTRGGATTA